MNVVPTRGDMLFVLGAADPEMHAIERLLAERGVPCVPAMVDGKRVYPANAYKAEAPSAALAVRQRGGKVFLVECVGDAPAGATRIDHHYPGDPGYGRPPAEYWQASSIGQTVTVLVNGVVGEISVTSEMRMVAAADHCLGAAYRGECPGVDPDRLLAWHVASRAAFERRSEEKVMRDVESARAVLRQAPRVALANDIYAADMRATPVRELLMAAAREGSCCLSSVVARDGRTKIGCLVGSPAQVSAFMQTWAPAQQLVDIYGDPVRGFAGGYVA
ncbi:MAG: hypothetical protein JSR56_01310 [Proteobacteria bacterium]|nr:hypothetical protein [Pseudomonadota bacterium]